MNDELTQEILDRLDRLGELGGQGFEILVRQQFLNGFMFLLWASFFATILLVFWRLLRHLGQLGGNQTLMTNHPDHIVAVIVSYIGFGGSSFATIGFIVSAAMRFLNPEFWAIKAVLDSVT